MLAELEAAVEPAFVHPDHADGNVETLVISSCISLYQATVCQHRCAALWIDRSIALFESLSDPRKVAAIQICYVARSWVKAHQYVTVAEEGLAELRNVLNVARQYSFPDVIRLSYDWLAIILTHWGRSDETEQVMKEAMDYEQRSGMSHASTVIAWGWHRFFCGEQWEQAIELLHGDIECMDQAHIPAYAAIERVTLAHFLLARNELSHAYINLQTAQPALELMSDYCYTTKMWWGFAKLHTAQGDLLQAQAWYERILSRWKTTEDTLVILSMLLDGILFYADTGNFARARHWLSELQKVVRITANPVGAAALLEAQGVVAAKEGALEEAIVSLRQAVDSWSKVKRRYQQALASQRLAGLLLNLAGSGSVGRARKEAAQEEAEMLLSWAEAVYERQSKKLDNKAEEQYTTGIQNVCSLKEHSRMGHATRTTKLSLDLGKRDQGGANAGKQAALSATVEVLETARAFYLDFFLAHADKLAERVVYYSEKHLEMRERAISANELLTWAESCTVSTKDHPHPWAGWNFSERFPDLPFAYRRSVIKDAIGKARSYLSHRATWEKSGKKKGKPGLPGASEHPTLYKGTWELDLSDASVKNRFVRLKVYDGLRWQWVNYPLKCSRHFQQRHRDPQWEQESPLLILTNEGAALHFPQTRRVEAKKVKESKLDPELVTVAVDLNVRNLAVITVRQRGQIIETVFVTDHGLDQARYRHLKKIARKQWQTGKPIKGERSNQDLWQHVRRMNEDAAHQVAHRIASVCANYPGCVLLFERLRKIKPKVASKSRRMNRRAANQLRGKINQYAREQAFATCATCTVEVNPHGTSQYCSRCGKPGERFSYRAGRRIVEKWGKLFWCPHCHYQAHADFNGSANVHHSFFQELHWNPRPKRSG